MIFKDSPGRVANPGSLGFRLFSLSIAEPWLLRPPFNNSKYLWMSSRAQLNNGRTSEHDTGVRMLALNQSWLKCRIEWNPFKLAEAPNLGANQTDRKTIERTDSICAFFCSSASSWLEQNSSTLQLVDCQASF